MQQIIFEPFLQVETGTTRNYGGNGLSLALTKAYIELLGGTIKLKSGINAGTKITVSLPVNSEQDRIIDPPLKEQNKVIKTVLIAEDEYPNYLYLDELLDEFNLKILYAENGEKALNLCRINSDFDLILMDIKMPIMDRYVSAKLIKEFHPEMPILAQIAYAKESEIGQYQGIFDYYLTKPIKQEIIKQIFSKITR
jgi:CheY-like chemotaxis protein